MQEYLINSCKDCDFWFIATPQLWWISEVPDRLCFEPCISVDILMWKGDYNFSRNQRFCKSNHFCSWEKEIGTISSEARFSSVGEFYAFVGSWEVVIMIMSHKDSSYWVLLCYCKEAIVFIGALNFLPLGASNVLRIKHLDELRKRRVKKDKKCWHTSRIGFL